MPRARRKIKCGAHAAGLSRAKSAASDLAISRSSSGYDQPWGSGEIFAEALAGALALPPPPPPPPGLSPLPEALSRASSYASYAPEGPTLSRAYASYAPPPPPVALPPPAPTAAWGSSPVAASTHYAITIGLQFQLAQSVYKEHFFGREGYRSMLISAIKINGGLIGQSARSLGDDHPLTHKIVASFLKCFDEQLDWSLDDIPHEYLAYRAGLLETLLVVATPSTA